MFPIDSKTGKLIINQFDVHHIISRFIDGGSLQEAIEKELYHHYSHYGLEGEWDFDANKIVFERRGQYF